MQEPVSRRFSPRLLPRLIAATLALAAAQGCVGERIKSLSELNALRQALVREYRHEFVKVNLRDVSGGPKVLSVVFVNSPFNRLGEAERARKGQEIAAFARGSYAGAAGVGYIVVAFVRGETHFFVFHSREVVGYYPFLKNQILESEVAAAGGGAAGVDKKARASYSPNIGETTVQLSPLQIYGDLNDGLVLLASFAVRGEKVRAPREVDFEFLSYSKRRVFADDDRLTVTADGSALATRAPKLTTHGLGQDGTYAEIIKHRLTYKEFLRLAGSRSAKVRLGPKEFNLTGNRCARCAA